MKIEKGMVLVAVLLATLIAAFIGYATAQIPQAGGWGMFWIILFSELIGALLLVIVLMSRKKNKP